MVSVYKDSSNAYFQPYHESSYGENITGGEVQIIRPVDDSKFVDSSELRVYLGLDNDYEMGILLHQLCKFKRYSPTALYPIFAASNIYPGYTMGMKEQLQSLSSVSEKVNYNSDIGLSTALQYLGSVWRANRRHELVSIIAKPSNEIVNAARLLIDRVTCFNDLWNKRSVHVNDSFNSISFKGKSLTYMDVPSFEIACNDMARKAFIGNPNISSDEQLSVWNKVNASVLRSSDYSKHEGVKYTVIYNPTIDIVFVWCTHHIKR